MEMKLPPYARRMPRLTRRTLRHWAATVALMCLFGIGSGVANACLGHAAPAHASDTLAQRDDEGDCGAPAKRNCQDFCDKSSMSMPQAKAGVDLGHAAAMPPLRLLTAMPVATPTLVPQTSPARDDPRAPPLAITLSLLRLAL
jgi:hypothetical protein